MKLVVCWTNISGYMAACWRALAERPGIELDVIAYADAHASSDTAFDSGMLAGIPHRLLSPRERDDGGIVERLVRERHPDVVLVCGWGFPAYRRLSSVRGLANVPFIMSMDTPWLGTARQTVTIPLKCRYVRRMAAVLVAGERAAEHARRIRVPEGRIHKGVYAYDERLFHAGLLEERLKMPGGWPRRFLYVGRYVVSKGVDVLLEGYAAYRRSVSDPWSLTCCGRGALGPRVAAADGVTDLGFVQPEDQPAVLRDHGAFVFPSRYEPWGVVLAEALASGLPAVCSTAVGAGVELLHPHSNGWLVPPADPGALAGALRRIHDRADDLPAMGRRAAAVAPGYAATVWARRVEAICHEVAGHTTSSP
ncbi:MAG: glycosyltransferase family 4 protein [Planctomycetes bacterium]|nr:glycosyltransferase family 4 protein [Planctomycetota bacterium]